MKNNEFIAYPYIPNIYSLEDIEEFFNQVDFNGWEFIQANKKEEYLNIPCAFDIETSSLYTEENEKFATMYIWQFAVNGVVIIGRKWDEFELLLKYLSDHFNLSTTKRMIIYVHNLAYEFQFIANRFIWNKVFASKARRPIVAITGAFEFRCSYILSNYSLDYLGKNLLIKYPVAKLTGSLDYSKIRHFDTPLTEIELKYCVNDVLVVTSYIQEKIEQDGDISCIPLTNTGYIRRYVREECFSHSGSPQEQKRKKMEYKALMKSLKITSDKEYELLKRAFMGGFSHASLLHYGQTLENVHSFDIASSYPYVMIAEYFPMTKSEYVGKITNEKIFYHYLKNYCCIFDIKFINLKSKISYENYLSRSKCITTGEYTNNGRIIKADTCCTTITEIDFDIISKCYTWDCFAVENLYIYERGYLPKKLIQSVLELYADKTTLKGIASKKTEYMVSKNMINSCFGMMVTAIVRDEYKYENGKGWDITPAMTSSQLKSYNNSWNRFLSYAWGVYVTAHARKNLWDAIFEAKSDYIYSDTDSIKLLNYEDHLPFFESQRVEKVKKLLKMCDHYSIDYDYCQPKDPKGNRHLIGVWEDEGNYKLFKTIGSKRYMYTYDNNFTTFTISGINKKEAMPYLIAKYNSIPLDSPEYRKIYNAYHSDNPATIDWLINQNYDYEGIFYYFGEGMYIPKGYSGKLTMTYVDTKKRAVVTDYTGQSRLCVENSFIHMEPQDYLISVFDGYEKFILNIEELKL